MTFEEYLIGKKIDLEMFRQHEPVLFETWRTEFVQMHPHSFSAQKLYLINPLRRKYQLKNIQVVTSEKNADTVVAKADAVSTGESPMDAPPPKAETSVPKPPRPVFKPKPKIS